MKIKIIVSVSMFFSWAVFFSRPVEAMDFEQLRQKASGFIGNVPDKYWLGVAIFLSLTVIFCFWKKYKKNKGAEIDWQDYEVTFGENIQTLSFKFETDWKTLAKKNNLKDPYVLEVGQIVKVPKIEDGKNNRLLSNLEKEDLSISENESMIDLKNNENKTQESFGNNVSRGMEVNYVLNDQDSSGGGLKEKNSGEIDGSLFFGGEEFDNQKPQKEGFDSDLKNVDEKNEIKQAAGAEMDGVKPLAKNESKEESVFIEEKIDENTMGYSEDLFIKGDEGDVKKSANRSTYFLLFIILILSGIAVFLFFQGKKNNFSLPGTSNIISETEESSNKTENIGSESDRAAENEPKKEEDQTEGIDGTKLTVKVLNGSGAVGAAGKIKDLLLSEKYEKVEAGNYSSEEVVSSAVYYKEDKLKGAAQEVADILKDKKIEAEVKSASSEEEKSADIVIVLGK